MNDLTREIWKAAGGEPAAMALLESRAPAQTLLPSVYDVDRLARASVGAAGLAAAEFWSVRGKEPMRHVEVDPRAAAAAFIQERLFAPDGWELPPAWDPIAGDYSAADGWIRLHTNYAHRRAAALEVLGVEPDRGAVAAAVANWAKLELETAIVQAGGCAAAMHSRDEWITSSAGGSTAREPLARISERDSGYAGSGAGPAPFAGIRVLDITRVIAGPTATWFLAGYGADVLRIDPPGFEEVPALVPITSAGKRCAELDLAAPRGRELLAELIEEADVLVSGLRPGALERLGLGTTELAAINPSLISATLDAYGWDGPLRARRGFDSLVQMSCGLADAGMRETGAEQPVPLPAQALDYATGFVLAAAVGTALTRREREGMARDIRCSLIGTANVLLRHHTPDQIGATPVDWGSEDVEQADTFWGPARRVPVPAAIEGFVPALAVEPGPFGRHEPRWTDRT